MVSYVSDKASKEQILKQDLKVSFTPSLIYLQYRR